MAHLFHWLWADNSKTKIARVFIRAYDTHLHKLSSRVKFHKAILYRSRVFAQSRSTFGVCAMCRQFVERNEII